MATAPRLLFFRPAPAMTTPSAAIPFQTGAPMTAGSTLRDHLEAFRQVGNAGNMIHRMAMAQMLVMDRDRSSHVHLFRLIGSGGIDAAAKMISANFDGVALTFSNIIRDDASEPNLAAFLKLISCDIYAVGIGLQDEMPADLSLLKPDIRDLLLLLNERAKLFGVRGRHTAQWLHKVGLRNAVPIGCPSMFVYPRNIMALKPPRQVARVITGGYMPAVKEHGARMKKLMAGFDGVFSAYVFQGEHRKLEEIIDAPGLYDEALGRFDAEVMSNLLSKPLGRRPPFSEYYSFNEPGAWRQACLRFDAYVGDRIHGGVAAMQAGVPSLVLSNDARVSELTEHHGIPSCTLAKFSEIGVRRSVAEHLSEKNFASFHKRYRVALHEFGEAVRGSGLALVHQPDIDALGTDQNVRCTF